MAANLSILDLPRVPLTSLEESSRLEQRQKDRVAELQLQGWAPGKGWLVPPQSSLMCCSSCGKEYVGRWEDNICRSCWARDYKESDR